MCAFQRDGRVDFSQTFRLRRRRKARLDALAERVKAALHAANALEQACIDECGDRFAVFVDQHAVVPVLHLIEHFAKVLAEVDRASFGNHDVLADMILMAIMVWRWLVVKL